MTTTSYHHTIVLPSVAKELALYPSTDYVASTSAVSSSSHSSGSPLTSSHPPKTKKMMETSISSFSGMPPTPYDSYLRPGPPINFIPYAIFTVFSAPCFGIPALVHAILSRKAYQEGNAYEAWHHSKISLVLSSIGNVLLAAVLLVAVTIVMTGFPSNNETSVEVMRPIDNEIEPTAFASTPEPLLEKILRNGTMSYYPIDQEDLVNYGAHPLIKQISEIQNETSDGEDQEN